MQGNYTIMVAIGFSSYSEDTFRYAVELARKFDADLLVASVINSRDVEAVRSVASMGYEVDGEQYIAVSVGLGGGEFISNVERFLIEGFCLFALSERGHEIAHPLV